LNIGDICKSGQSLKKVSEVFPKKNIYFSVQLICYYSYTLVVGLSLLIIAVKSNDRGGPLNNFYWTEDNMYICLTIEVYN
jgi:hypothetical protein